MKTLLQGGPKDGQVIDTQRNDFAIGYITEITDTKSGKVTSCIEHKYKNSYEPIHHPCKKKGTVRVFKYVGELPATVPEHVRGKS